MAPGRALRGLDAHLRHHRRRRPPHRSADVPAQPGPGRGLPVRGAHHVGRRLPDGGGPGRDGGQGAQRRLPPPAFRRHRNRDDPARARGRLRGPGRSSRRRALHRTVRDHGAHAGLRRRSAGAGPPAGRARQGIGHRHDLHVRRRDRCGVVARARPAHPLDRDAQRAHQREPAPRRARWRGVARPSPGTASTRPGGPWSNSWPPQAHWWATPGPSPTR